MEENEMVPSATGDAHSNADGEGDMVSDLRGELAQRDEELAAANAKIEDLRQSLGLLTSMAAQLAGTVHRRDGAHRTSLERISHTLVDDPPPWAADAAQLESVLANASALAQDQDVAEPAGDEDSKKGGSVEIDDADEPPAIESPEPDPSADQPPSGHEETAALQARLTAREGELSTTCRALAGAETRLELAQEQYADLSARLNDRERVLSDLQRETEALAEREAQLGLDLGDREYELQNLRLQFDDTLEELQSSQETLTQLNSTLAEQEAALAEREARIVALEENLDVAEEIALETDLARAETAILLATSEDEIAKLREQIVEFGVDLEDSLEIRSRLEEQIAGQTEQLRDLDQRVQRTSDELSEATAAKVELEAVLDEQRVAAAGQDDEIAALRSDMATESVTRAQEIDVNLAESAARVESLQGALEDAIHEKTGLETQLLDRDEEVGVLNSQLETLRADLNGLEDEKADLSGQLAAKQDELAAVQAELKEATDSAAGEIESKAAQITELAAQVSAVKFTLEQRDSQLARAEETSSALQGEMGSLQDSLEARTSDLFTLQAEQADLQKHSDNLTQKGAQLQSVIDQKTGQVEELTDEATGLKAEVAARIVDIETLDADIRRRQAEMESLRAQFDEIQGRQQSLQLDYDGTQEQLQATQSDLSAAQTRLTSAEGLFDVAPDGQAPDVDVLNLTPVKSSAAANALVTGARPRWAAAPQNLSAIKGIGQNYEQRLLAAGVGTYWEVASLSDDEFVHILSLGATPRHKIYYSNLRAEALKLAEETDTVGQLWEAASVVEVAQKVEAELEDAPAAEGEGEGEPLAEDAPEPDPDAGSDAIVESTTEETSADPESDGGAAVESTAEPESNEDAASESFDGSDDEAAEPSG